MLSSQNSNNNVMEVVDEVQVRKLSRLPDDVAKKIRSDFTINSLELCVKELLENSLDARATRIDIKLEKMGYDSVTVQDNGVGVPRDELIHVCKRFYTSKFQVIEEGMSDENDHDEYCYLGFRGEALHSLCANCEELTMITKTESDDLATKIVFDSDGNIVNETKISGNRGTTVIVKGLFARGQPVRRAKLRDNLSAEHKRMIDRITEYSLSPRNCEVMIKVIDKTTNKMVFNKIKNSSVFESISNVFSRMASQQLICLKSEELPDNNLLAKQVSFKVTLYVPRLTCLVAPTGMQSKSLFYIYLNGRPIDNKDIVTTLKTNYQGTGVKLFLAICSIEYDSLNTLKENVDVLQTPDKRGCVFAYQIQVQKLIRDALEMQQAKHKEVESSNELYDKEMPTPIRPITSTSTSPANVSMNTSMNTSMDATPRRFSPATTPSHKTVIVTKPAERQTTSPLLLIPDENGNMAPMEPIKFSRHYTKTSTSPGFSGSSSRRTSGEQMDLDAPVRADTTDKAFFDASKYISPDEKNSKKRARADSEEDEPDSPHNRSIFEFFGSDSQKEHFNQETKQKRKRRKASEPEPDVLDMSEYSRDKRAVSADIAVVANISTDSICSSMLTVKELSEPPISTKFFKAWEDRSQRISVKDLSQVTVIGVPPCDNPKDFSRLFTIVKQDLIMKDKRSYTQEENPQRPANCNLLLFSVFEAEKFIQEVTTKNSASYETMIRPLDNPINLLKIPKFKENNRILSTLTSPFFDKVLKQNGFHVKHTKTSSNQQNRSSQTQSTKTVLLSLELVGILKLPDVDKMQGTNLSGTFGIDDLYDFAVTLTSFKQKSMSKVVEQLMSYRLHEQFKRDNPITTKSPDELKEYVTKKALYLLRPQRIAKYIEKQAIELAETRRQQFITKDGSLQYDEESLTQYASDLVQKLKSALPMCSPLIRLLSSTAASINVEYNKAPMEEKMSAFLSNMFSPICNFE